MKFGRNALKIMAALIFSAAVSGMFTGCSGILGYSVLLWNCPDKGISDGTILKVHVKSNISHVYIVSIPGTKEKFEIPLWQATDPVRKGKALKIQKRYSQYEHTYAGVKLDGLPIRAEAVNTSKQIYRLRKGEVIRCLYRGAGADVTNGRGNMEGEWLRVVTFGGTQGWCFSHNLDLFQTSLEVVYNGNGAGDKSASDSSAEATIKKLLEKKWYPESYLEMVKSRRIDVNKMKSSYGFDFGIPLSSDEVLEENTVSDEKNQISFSGTASYRDESGSYSWQFTDITKKTEKEYSFKDTNLLLVVKNQNNLVIKFMEKGKVKAINLVALTENVEELIENELNRRQNELKAIASAGPVFRSSNYGTIEFNNENSITWRNYKLLVPSVISADAMGSVTVTVRYFISNSLRSSYDGVITMQFLGMENEVNFLYKLTENGLRLEDASKAPVKDGVITARSPSPTVLFFEKN